MLVKAVDQINNCCSRLLISLSAISILNKELWVRPWYERTHKDKDSLHSPFCTHFLEIVDWTLGLDLDVAFLLDSDITDKCHYPEYIFHNSSGIFYLFPVCSHDSIRVFYTICYCRRGDFKSCVY